MKASQLSQSSELSDSQGFANFMAAKDKKEEHAVFKQVLI